MTFLFSGSGDAGNFGHRSLGNGRNSNGRMSPVSPLKRFGQAKKNINEIFKDILDFISEADKFVEGECNMFFYHWRQYL